MRKDYSPWWSNVRSLLCVLPQFLLSMACILAAAVSRQGNWPCSPPWPIRCQIAAYANLLTGQQVVVALATAVVNCGRGLWLVCRLLSSAASGKEADAYEVLGVQPTASSGEVKKKYWRLSLLIHPDKCSHPRANDAFQAVSKVSKDLQVRLSGRCCLAASLPGHLSRKMY